MMKKTKLTKRLVFLFAAAAFCALAAVGCGAKTGAEGNQENGSSTDNDSKEISLAETEENQESGSTADDEYEVVYSEELETNEGNIPFEISLSGNLYTEGDIKIDGQEIPIDPELAEIGYAHPETLVYDFTGDGKEEIALVISGGASGAVQGLQVFCNTDGTWEEMEIPSEIYDDPPEFLEKKLEEIGIEVSDSISYYRTFLFDKEKILIGYPVFGPHSDESEGSTAVASIRKELYYSSDQEGFVLGDTMTVNDGAIDEVEVPNYMQPDTVMLYDENLDYTFEQGGEDADASKEGSGVYAYPGMKAVYDEDGLLSNVYYPVLGEPDSYQLSPPDDALLDRLMVPAS